MKLIEDIRAGTFPAASSLLDTLASFIPLIEQLDETPQDAEWHAEGSVRVHTEMVLEEMFDLLRSGDCPASPGEVVGLVLGAALHDIGKVLTTREEEISGRIRITSPRHAERGRSYVVPLLDRLAVSAAEKSLALAIIRLHHEPKKLVLRSAGQSAYSRLARGVDLRWLYYFEQCDLRGRDCSDLQGQLEILEYFRIEAEGFPVQLWQDVDPYRHWRDVLGAEMAVGSVAYQYGLDVGIYDYERGKIHCPEEALARSWQHREHHSVVTILSAPSGSGKSTVCESLAAEGATIISLDEIRAELTGSESDQSRNGRVLQEAKERLRVALRAKHDVCWDSTTLRRDMRSMVIDLAHDYHAYTRVLPLCVDPRTAKSRNRDRSAQKQVPASVIEKQYHTWQWPDYWEAHARCVSNLLPAIP